MKFRSAIRSIGLTLLAASLLSVPACYGVTREFAQTYHLKPDGTLELNNINGTVRIEGWDKMRWRCARSRPPPTRNPSWISSRST